ncbi:KEX1 [Symbiodinium natans]|uniref:KEX1 protein n=1 Tax=Symbiodinium natans TaxID=878477 RepID=A0A812JNW4_9DINO|nr:KEX1 [Symbiodinium natans]
MFHVPSVYVLGHALSVELIFTSCTWCASDASTYGIVGPVAEGLVNDFETEQGMRVIEALLDAGKGYRVVTYNGVRDGSVCNHLGNLMSMKALKWNGTLAFNAAATTPWRPLGSLAGYQRSSGALSYYTILYTGHLVPMIVPDTARAMIEEIVNTASAQGAIVVMASLLRADEVHSDTRTLVNPGAKAKLGQEDFSQAHQRLEDRRGKEVKFSDQPEVPGPKEDIVLRLWRRLPETPLPNLYWVGGIFTAIWGYRMWGAFTRLMIIRYADVNYQLRRPDVLANKVVALRYLVLPLLVVPGVAMGIGGLAILLSDGAAEDSRNPLARLLQGQAFFRLEGSGD